MKYKINYYRKGIPKENCTLWKQDKGFLNLKMRGYYLILLASNSLL